MTGQISSNSSVLIGLGSLSKLCCPWLTVSRCEIRNIDKIRPKKLYYVLFKNKDNEIMAFMVKLKLKIQMQNKYVKNTYMIKK